MMEGNDSCRRLFHETTMSRTAKVTLGAAATFCSVTIFAVHYMQRQEREVRAKFRTRFACSSFFLFSRRRCIKAWSVMTHDDWRSTNCERRHFMRVYESESCMRGCRRYLTLRSCLRRRHRWLRMGGGDPRSYRRSIRTAT